MRKQENMSREPSRVLTTIDMADDVAMGSMNKAAAAVRFDYISREVLISVLGWRGECVWRARLNTCTFIIIEIF